MSELWQNITGDATLGSRGSLRSYRFRRFLAFVIDIVALLLLLSISYACFRTPDFPGVKIAMDQLTLLRGTAEETAAAAAVFSAFDRAYVVALLLYFGYEIVFFFLLKGATPGKRICGLRIVTMRDGQGNIKTALRAVVRSAVKMIFMYFFNGIPFIISTLSLFANALGRAGVDYFAGTKVLDTKSPTEDD
jgi:uncharacterized RDD family membrane protein YckC